jgi:spoIIIJ-associated protein
MSEMRTSLEVIAPSVEEAIDQGVTELGIDPDELEIEILDEGSKGLLGLGSRQARVRLTIKEEKPPSEEVAVDISPPVSVAEDDEEVQRVTEETVKELLQRMGFRATVYSRWGEPEDEKESRYLKVDIRGDNLGALIGRRSETLSAFQYITRLIVGKELQRPAPIIIDVGGYRARRERQLRRMARKMAQQAIERKRTMTLEPMAPHERRIIHIELRDRQDVDTESVGEGSRRKVTIIPHITE